MPEAPEVKRIVDSLRSELVGLRVLELAVSEKSPVKYHGLLDKAHHLVKQKCIEILCKGKYIFFFFENHTSLFGGLGMTGQFLYDFDKHPKFWLELDNNSKLKSKSVEVCVYHDARNFGNWTIGTWEEAFAKMETFGVDLLAVTQPILLTDDSLIEALEEFGIDLNLTEQEAWEVFYLAITNKRRKNTLVANFLLTTDSIYGIGNYLKSEILYAAKISPYRTLGNLSDTEIEELFDQSLLIMTDSYLHGGLTIDSYQDPNRAPGKYKKKVYNKDTDPEGNPITCVWIGSGKGRATYYVESIQV